MDANKQKYLSIVILFILAFLVIIFSPFWGSKTFSLSDISPSQIHSRDFQIFWQMRIPRSLVAFFAGAIFALCGMVFQAVFRNPLVCPFTLGVSAGASFGASLYIWMGFSFAVLGISGITVFSFLGAFLAMMIVWSLSQIHLGTSTAKMLLAGVIVSFFFVSLIMLVQSLSGVYESFRITRWLMGSLALFGYGPLLEIMPFALVTFFVIGYFTRELNLLAMGDEIAVSRGVNLKRLIKVLFLFLSIIIGRVVSICGPIAFIGIIAPHICRLLVGPDHKFLAPASLLFGGLFLTLCDMFARTIAPPVEIPVGVITAIIGGPFFLWLLYSEAPRTNILGFRGAESRAE